MTPSPAELRKHHEAWVPHTPGFPVDVSGANGLHAAFREESRTRGCRVEPLAGSPGILLLLAICGSTTAVSGKLCGRPTSRQLQRDVGHPGFLVNRP
jgi:hypothetical protein